MDEAGDTTFFGRRGKVLVGSDGCSHCFMLGVAHIPDPNRTATLLNDLRANLLADPWFKDVPSMQPASKKTAICFHAKDDLPEVRREVFKLIQTMGAKFQAAFRRKTVLIENHERAARFVAQRPLNGDGIYDDLVARIFKKSLHKADENEIVFARRGKSARTSALYAAIERAKRNFRRASPAVTDKPVSIDSKYPHESVGLQVVDYFLWALQRMVEKRECRFFDLISSDVRLVMDLDDTTHKDYGAWYSDSHPLTLERLKAL